MRLSAANRAAVLEWLPVAGIVLAAWIAASAFVLQLSEFVIWPDELGYVKQAIVLSHGDLPTPGSFWFNSWALLHSAILAPLYRFASTTTAFDAGHVIGALLMSSTAIPVYLLGRRVLAWKPGALLAAALTVATPWLAMSGSMMTEVVAYPAFAWACLAMLHGVSRPGMRNDLLVGLALAVAFVSRTQLLILAPAYVLALAIDVLVRRDDELRTRLRTALREHAAMIAVVVPGTLVVLATGSTRRVLGSYSDPTHGALFPPGTGAATRELVVYVVVAIGAVPLAMAAAWAATTLGRRVPRDEHAAAALIVSVVPLLAAVGGSFTVRYTSGINDRYFFYVVPLLFLGALAALARRRRWFPLALAVSGGLTVWMIWTSLISQQGPTLISPSMAWHTWLSERAGDLGVTMPHLVAIGTAVALIAVGAAAQLLSPRAGVAMLGAVLLIWCVAETAYTFDKLAATQRGASPDFIRQRNWVDRALPKNARAIEIVASLGEPVASAATWWDTTFWNKSIDRVLTLGAGSPYDLGFHQSFTIDQATGRAAALDRYQYVVRYANDTRFGLRGSNTVAGNGGILVLTAARPYQAEWSFEGPDPNAGIVAAGQTGKLRAFAPGGSGPGKVAVTFAAGAAGVPVAIRSGGTTARRTIPAEGRATVTVATAYTRPGYADLVVSVAPSAPKNAVATLIGVTQS